MRGIIDPGADGGQLQLPVTVPVQDAVQIFLVGVFVQPASVILRGDDHRHALMHGLHQRVGRCRDDGAGIDAFGFPFPVLPEAGEGEQAVVGAVDMMGLFAGRRLLPLIEAGRGNQAAAFSEGAAERRLLGQGFAPGVDHVTGYAPVLAPGGQQPPLQINAFATAIGQLHDIEYRLPRC